MKTCGSRRFFCSMAIFVVFLLLLAACGSGGSGECQHQYGVFSITRDAGCANDGVQSRTCEKCGYLDSLLIPALGHAEVIDLAVDATCSQPGLTEGKHCSQCNMVLVKQETIAKLDHTLESGAVTKDATCTDAGAKTSTCSTCGETVTESIKALGHSFDSGEVTKEATCTAAGTKTLTCSVCGETKNETVKAVGHKFDSGEVTKDATCTEPGIKTYSCTACGQKKNAEIAKLGHSSGNNFICARCGAELPVTLNMTSSEKTAASKVQYISQRQIWHDDTDNCFILVYSLLDQNEAELTAPAIVEIAIENDKGAVVYKAIKVVKSSDFQTWYYNNGSVKKHQATIYIYDDEITAGAVDSGKIKFTVYNEGYFSFNETTLSIYDNLPVKQTTVVFPDMPLEISELAWDGRAVKSYKITEATCEVTSYGSMSIYLSGVKTHDSEGSKNRDYVRFGWQLRDEDGYIVDSGNVFGNQIAVNEKFKREQIYISGDIEIGGTYYFEILAGEVTPENIVTINIPMMPRTIHDYGYNGKISSTCTVTSITYTIDEDGDITLFFSGEKTYDSEGSGYSRSCYVGWKLYDSDGFVVDSGTFYSPQIRVGEKFKDEKETIYADIELGETYRLEISHVD